MVSRARLAVVDMTDSSISLICGDILEWAPTQPDNHFDLVFGSPPYEDRRKYPGTTFRRGQDWVDWMVDVTLKSLRICKGLVAFVVEGRTKQFEWSAIPVLLMADLVHNGVCLRKPPIFMRHGIMGSGGPDWLRNDYEFVVCATNGGKLPWSNNTAMGHPPKYPPGGPPSHRTTATSGYRGGDTRVQGAIYKPPKVVNPGNVIHCRVGGGHMGHKLAHENEAPFPESLAEFFVRSFCPPGGRVLDPFSGSGTTMAVCMKTGRDGVGLDIRESQRDLAARRLVSR